MSTVILIIEDETELLDALAYSLEKAGFGTREPVQARKAPLKHDLSQPDLVLLTSCFQIFRVQRSAGGEEDSKTAHPSHHGHRQR